MLALKSSSIMESLRGSRVEPEVPFPDEVIQLIYDAAGGVPRDILRFCDGAFELAQFVGEKTVTAVMAQSIIERESQIMSDEVEAV